MTLTEAYRKLGYSLENTRQDWSAVNETGVCLSVWRSETGVEGGQSVLDTRGDKVGPIEDWRETHGGRKRDRHIARAIAEHEGLVDVVLIGGQPGRNGEAGWVVDPDPWVIAKRPGRWRVTVYDPETGHFRLAVEPKT